MWSTQNLHQEQGKLKLLPRTFPDLCVSRSCAQMSEASRLRPCSSVCELLVWTETTKIYLANSPWLYILASQIALHCIAGRLARQLISITWVVDALLHVSSWEMNWRLDGRPKCPVRRCFPVWPLVWLCEWSKFVCSFWRRKRNGAV